MSNVQVQLGGSTVQVQVQSSGVARAAQSVREAVAAQTAALAAKVAAEAAREAAEGFADDAATEATTATTKAAEAAASAVDAETALAGTPNLSLENLWPDTFFRDSDGDENALDGTEELYSISLDNRTWNPTLKHDYGLGGWTYSGASGAAQGYDTHYAGPAAESYNLQAGDTVTAAFRVKASGGVDVICRLQFFSALVEGVYTTVGATVSGATEGIHFVTNLNGEATIKVTAEIPATAIGHVAWVDQLSTTVDFHTTAYMVVKGDISPVFPPIRETYEGMRRRVQPMIDAAVGGINGDLLTLPGTNDTASDRVGVALSQWGIAKGLYWQPERMQAINVGLRQLLQRQTGLVQFGLCSDSWGARQYFIREFTQAMCETYGDGGPGWIGFGFLGSDISGNARDLYTVTKTGAWTSEWGTGTNSPSLSNAKSSTAGDKLTITAATVDSIVPTAILANARLFYEATADGVIRHRCGPDSGSLGSWTTVNVQGTVGTNQNVALTNIPTTAAHVWEIEVVSGSVDLHGVYAVASKGWVTNRYYLSGGQVSSFTGANRTQWVASMLAMGNTALGCLFGTNEGNGSVAAATFAANVAEFLDRAADAAPGGDRLVIQPPDNANGNTIPSSAYNAAVDEAVETHYAAKIDLQRAFGPALADYDGTGPRDWLNDANHPAWAYFFPVILDVMLGLFKRDSYTTVIDRDAIPQFKRGITAIRNSGAPALGWGLKGVSTGGTRDIGLAGGTQDFDVSTLTFATSVTDVALLGFNGTGSTNHDLLNLYSNTTRVFRVTDGGDIECFSKAGDNSLQQTWTATSGGGVLRLLITGGALTQFGTTNNVALRLQANNTDILTLSNLAARVGINETIPDYALDVNGTFGFTPGASVTPVDNGDVVFELTSNTSLTVKAKGSDGTVRSVVLTLA